MVLMPSGMQCETLRPGLTGEAMFWLSGVLVELEACMGWLGQGQGAGDPRAERQVNLMWGFWTASLTNSPVTL